MSTTTSQTRTRRVIQIFGWILERGFTTNAEVGRRFDVTPRTARQDLRLLADSIDDIHSSGVGRATRWIVDPAARIRYLGILDRVSLLLGRDLASFLEGTALHGGLERVGTDSGERVRLGSDPHLDRKFRALHEPARRYGDQHEVLDEILDGLLRERTLSLCYGVEAETARWHPPTRPLTLTVYRRALYLLASPEEGAAVRRWSISKIHQVRLGSAFDYPASWDPDAELADCLGIHAAPRSEQVIIDFKPEVAHYVRVRRWAAVQSLTTRPGGGLRLEMTSGGKELVRWVLEWGDKARVVSPAWLQAEVIAELSGALKQYEQHEQHDRRQP